ncbi:IPT/TIG domain-containing protein [Candidatus Bathyarchaeota archaeon]|nr:IPT/TIG domain-containing protein [Candidatus Bathyarchaeota archaeon]
MMHSRGLRALLLVTLMMTVLSFATPTYANPVTIDYVVNKDTGVAVKIPSKTPNNGTYDQVIIVNGTGVTAGKTVKLYWDLVQDWDGKAGLLNSTKAKADGSFEIWFKVPEATNGVHWIWIEDVSSSTYDYVNFTILATLELSADSGLPGDEITVDGYGFSSKANVTIGIENVTFGGTYYKQLAVVSETSSLGSFTKTVTIPKGLKYGNYMINATDGKGVTTLTLFVIGPAVTFSPTSGPVGTVVTVTGRGFTANSYVKSILLSGINCTQVSTIKIGANGKFTGQFVIPSVAKTGKYTITVVDKGGLAGTEDFEITGLSSITVEPSHGVQGATVSIHGYNFTQLKGKKVGVLLVNATSGAVKANLGTFKTTADGEFSGTFTVPAVATGKYVIKANQTAYSINATTSFRAGLMIVILSPSEGPVGTKVTITGSGFTKGGTWNATFNGEDIGLGPAKAVAGDGTLSGTFYVPQVDVGTYTVTVLDIASDIEVTATFKVTGVPEVVVEPSSAPQGYNVTIKGWNFADIAGGALTFKLKNDTNTWDIGVWAGPALTPATTDSDGNFTAWWNFVDSTGAKITLDVGDYVINVTDSKGITVEVPFKVVEETIECSSRKAEYNIGDTVAFDIKSSFPKKTSYIEIYDPDGNLFWNTTILTTWRKVGTIYTVPYYSQVDASGNPMILPPDAPTGTWTWKWYNSTGTVLASGNFTVLPAVETLLEEKISSVEESVQSLSEDVAGLKEDISGVKSDVAALKSDVAAAASAAKDAKEAASAAQEAVAQIAETANAAKSAAEEAKAAAEEAKTAASGLTPLIYGAIGVSLIAALAAIVSLIQISRRIAG